MKLIVGLGNPGKKYQDTWHNIGFFMIYQIAISKSEEFLKFKKNSKLLGEINQGINPQEKIILVKPLTFMNRSGQAVKNLTKFYKIKGQDLWVIHDDIDLPLGKIRISQNSSAAGHKGVQSIINQLNDQNFVRFRIGIRPAQTLKLPTETYVLQKIDPAAKLIISEVKEKILAAIEVALTRSITEAMNEFN